MALSAEFIYFAARLACLAQQWMKERGIIVCTLIVGFIYLVARLARLARQWIERGIIDMRVKAGSARYTRGSLLLKHAPETRSWVSTPTSTHEGACS